MRQKWFFTPIELFIIIVILFLLVIVGINTLKDDPEKTIPDIQPANQPVTAPSLQQKDASQPKGGRYV